MTAEEYKEKKTLLVDYFFDDKDEKAAIETMKEWVGFDPDRVADFLTFFVFRSIERKGMDWQAANRFFRLLPTVLSAGAFKDGIAAIAGNIDDYRCDLPLAPQYIAQMFAGPIADGHLSFADLAEICKRAGPPKEKAAVASPARSRRDTS